jgi:hypothetical protein
MEFDAVFTVKKETSKEEFIRELLIELASSSKTPADVVKAKFGEVEESVREAIVCSAHVEMDYSASIGYDRQETYWTKEKKYNSSTKQYYYVDVEKTRTVTDWRPFSSHISGDKTACAFNEEYALMTNDLIVDVIKSTQDSSIVAKGEATLTYAGLEEAKKACARFLEYEIDYPGDHHKDTKTNADVTVEIISCYKLPYYTVEFTYEGKKYTASGFACGRPNIRAELPPNDVNIEEKVNKKTAKSKKLKSGLWFGFIGAFIFACVMCGVGAPWLCILPIGVLAAAIYFHIKYNKEYQETLTSLTTGVTVAKKTALDEALKTHSFEKLTKSEDEAFYAKAASDNNKFESSHKPKGVKARAIWAGIATVILVIVCIVTGVNQANAKLHSPNHLELEVVAKSEEYKSNVSHYINGCYFIYFDYEITSKKLGISDMSIITYVYDKNTGKELGYITTSLSGMNLDEGGTKTYTVELKENQPEKNNFFSTLYEMDFEDLEFKCEYDYIHFEDGEYYRGNLD